MLQEVCKRPSTVSRFSGNVSVTDQISIFVEFQEYMGTSHQLSIQRRHCSQQRSCWVARRLQTASNCLRFPQEFPNFLVFQRSMQDLALEKRAEEPL
jgi:hypothetical protein